MLFSEKLRVIHRIHLLNHLFSKYLLSTYDVASHLLTVEDTAGKKKKDQAPTLRELAVYLEFMFSIKGWTVIKP